MSDIDIFERQREKDALGLITNDQVLSQDHTPTSIDDVIGREKEKEEVKDFLFNVLFNKIRSDINIVGTSGLGKTYLLKAILSDVEKQYGSEFKYSFVNCKGFYPPSKFKLHNAILTPHDLVVSQGLGDIHTAKAIKSLISKVPLIVVLDEVDAIASAQGDLLYDLIELGLSLIMVSNMYDWEDKVDTRIQSRAQSNRLHFQPYSEDEIFNVLLYLRDRSLKPGVISDVILRMIAKKTKEEYLGDIRKAKNLIRLTVENAQEEGTSEIKNNHVTQALDDVSRLTLSQILSSFVKQELIALASLVSVQKDLHAHARGKIPEPTTGNIYTMFKKNIVANEGRPIGEARMKDYLKRFVDSELAYQVVKSYPTRGRVGYYHLAEEKYSVEDYYIALLNNGVKPWTAKRVDELFK